VPAPAPAGIARPTPPTLFTTDELTTLAGPGIDRSDWWAEAARCGFCANPIALRRQVAQADPTTGELRDLNVPTGTPDGLVRVPCGNRRAARCPACAERYRRDAYQLLKAGLVGGKGEPETARTHPAVFVTFTAPSFGEVHAHRTTRDPDPAKRRLLPCRPRRRAPICRHGVRLECWRRHRADDPAVGTPLCRHCYDYTGTVLWNAAARELWRRTTIYLPRALARLTKQTPQALAQQIRRPAFARVAEYQGRGVIHLHAVVRLDHAQLDTDGRVQPPPARYTTELLTQALWDTVHGAPSDPVEQLPAFAAVAVPITNPDDPDQHAEQLVAGWGRELDIRPIRTSARRALSAEQVAGYIAKYATKHTEALGPGLDRRLSDRRYRYLPHLGLRQHVLRLIQAAWTLGDERAFPHLRLLRLRQWAHQLGYGGHWSSRSRRYSTTFKALRLARRAFARRQGRTAGHRIGLDDLDDAITAGLIVVTWSYAGSGYRSQAERDLALAAAARARELARARRRRAA